MTAITPRSWRGCAGWPVGCVYRSPSGITASKQRTEDDDGDGREVDAGDGDELFERDVHHAEAGGDRLLVAVEEEDGGEHEVLADRAEGEEAGGDEDVAAHGQHDAAEGGEARGALHERGLLDL